MTPARRPGDGDDRAAPAAPADLPDPAGTTAPADALVQRHPDPRADHTPTDEQLRDLLPAIEPERRLDDWGRSERIEGLFDRVVADFLYHLWFRCDVEGIEHVPAEGGALVVANHAGALPPDAAMIAKAIKEEHPRGRPLHITVEHFFKGYPGFSVLLPKLGCVPAHPANVHRLLCDERQLVLVFPEGRKGTEKLFKDRYRLRRFGRGGFVEAAMRGGAPIVPVAVVGAEEAAPIFAHVPALKRLTGLIYFPITPTFPHLGLLGMLGYLPAKFRIRFLPPVPTDDMGDAPWGDKGLVQRVSDEVRATIQSHVLDMVGRRRSVWL
jgi:1-acyl-sn-glycerol-3-phosphate acyltransferase